MVMKLIWSFGIHDKNMKNIFNTKELCPVCGFNIYKCYGSYPWDNDIYSSEVCPSCGIEYGYEDSTDDLQKRQEVYIELRKKWIDSGMKWWGGDNDKKKPRDWDPQKQLDQLLN